MGGLLVVSAIVIAIVGAGLSYSGYNQSLQITTATRTLQVTATSTISSAVATVTSTSTESGTEAVLSDTIYLPAPGSDYCGWGDWRYVSIGPGQVHVTFSSGGRLVDFWVLTSEQWSNWDKTFLSRNGCTKVLRMPSLATKLGVSSFDSTIDIPSDGVYYFTFQNTHGQPVSVDLSVEASYQKIMVNEHTSYSTKSSPYVTETVVVGPQPAGFGLLFYSGIVLIIAGGLIAAVSRRKAVTQPGVPPTISVAPPVQVATRIPTAPAAGKYCIECGAPLPVHATFCRKCGTKQ
jgi:hypothetical protein